MRYTKYWLLGDDVLLLNLTKQTISQPLEMLEKEAGKNNLLNYKKQQ